MPRVPPKKRPTTVQKVSRKWQPKSRCGVREGSDDELPPHAVILPEILAADILNEHSGVAVNAGELADLLPQEIPPCPLKVESRVLTVAVGSASPAWKLKAGANIAIINTGCYVSTAAWAPAQDMAVLALAVNSRSQPSLAAEGPVPGTAATQFWSVDMRRPGSSAQLRLGVVHDAASVRCLQWLPSERTQERLGLLLAVLSTGALNIYSLPNNTFEEKAMPPAHLFGRFKPAWQAKLAPAGAEPASAWQRHLQCAAARESCTDPRSCIIAAGCERSVVLVWRLVSGLPLHEEPCDVLKPLLVDADTVVSVAWCPSADVELLAAGCAGGYVVLWNCQAATAPLRCFTPMVRTAHVGLDWADKENLCLPADGAFYNFMLGRLVKLRTQRRKGGACSVSCTGTGRTPLGLVSIWSDGVASFREKPLVRPRTTSGTNANEEVLQSWRVLGADLTKAPMPDEEGPEPREKDEAECKAFRDRLLPGQFWSDNVGVWTGNSFKQTFMEHGA